jgi:ATP-dependent Lon protease
MKISYESTKDVTIPKDPFERIIGQDEAVEIARIVPYQRRHLLLVGPPGTGKSLIAQAIASVLPKPKYEISVIENLQNSERPIVEIRDGEQIKKDKKEERTYGKKVTPLEVPSFVAEKLGYRCRRCGGLSNYSELICPHCGAEKTHPGNIFEKYNQYPQLGESGKARVATTRRSLGKREEIIIYERGKDGSIVMLTQKEIKEMENRKKQKKRNVIIPLSRSTFVQASGNTETELLGDIRHDPYGGHPQLGTPTYMRVVPGAVHEAHEGVLFIDELSTLKETQRFLLTSMQDGQFPIVGHNPMSSGAAVRVEGVPCDFILVGATNINDLKYVMPPLRSRIRGDGYEVLINVFMEENREATEKMLQFMAQEIEKDGRIPHADRRSMEELLKESKRIANAIDNVAGYTLRLRNLSGLIKMAGDLAKTEESDLIEKKHVVRALDMSRPIEDQLKDKYGSWWKSETADYGLTKTKTGPETA